MENAQEVESINRQIWDGDYWGRTGAVARARVLFAVDPEPHFHLYATALYSALGRAKSDMKYLSPLAPYRLAYCALELQRLLPRIRAAAYDRHTRPDDMDSIVSWLYGISRVAFVIPANARRDGRAWAQRAVDLGIGRAESMLCQPHTLPLLLISKARMLADRVPPRKPQLARYPLYEAIRLSERITDPRQLARAYKGIGDVYGLLGNNSERRAWRKKAATVPGIAEDTRAKLR